MTGAGIVLVSDTRADLLGPRRRRSCAQKAFDLIERGISGSSHALDKAARRALSSSPNGCGGEIGTMALAAANGGVRGVTLGADERVVAPTDLFRCVAVAASQVRKI